MEGLDGHFSNGKLQYKNFCRWHRLGDCLILRKAPISGSSTTRTLFPLFSYDNDAIFISSCIVCKCCHIVFASHFLCPKWAAARQTGSKSKVKVLVHGPNHGAIRCSACCRKKRGQNNLPNSDQLLTVVYYTKDIFAYFLFGRLEHFLKAGQQQHGFGPGGRLQEHFVTANLMLDETHLHSGGFLMTDVPSISYGSCNAYISDNVVKLYVTWGKAENSISQAACGKAAC